MVAQTRTHMDIGDTDRPEFIARKIDSKVTDKTGMSVFHVLALLSIFASIALFFSGARWKQFSSVSGRRPLKR